MKYVEAGPTDRVLDLKPGDAVSVAGDRKRRLAARAAAEAARQAKFNDPARQLAFAKEASANARDRLNGTLSAAQDRFANLTKHATTLRRERDEARNSAANMGDPAEAYAHLAEAAAADRKLNQLPAMLEKATADVDAARAALVAHDQRVTQDAQDRAADIRAREADADKLARAEAAAAAAFAQVMAEPDAPKPTTRKDKR